MLINANAIMVGIGVLTFVGSLVSAYFGIVLKGLQREDDLLGKRVDILHESIKLLESRLSSIERSYISRAEHAEFRSEMMNAVREIGERVSKSIDGLGARVEHLVERVATVEAEARP